MNNELVNEKIFFDGEEYFNSLLMDIARAQKTIDLETYIFQNDALGEKVARALTDAATKGVKVRVMVDGAGTPNWGNGIAKQLLAAGAQTRVFHPFPWRLWQMNQDLVHRPWLPNIFYLASKINKRNHRKSCLIDHNILYVGSSNIRLCHLSVDNGGKNWRDTGVRLEGENAQDLREAFEIAWNHQPLQERIQTIFERVDKNAVVRVNHTRHLRRSLYKSLLRRIARCKKRVWITNAYFVPDNFLLLKLTDLAQSGVDVRIMLPHKSDVIIMPWASAAFYDRLLKAGARIFEYNPTMLHAKSLILDDWFLIGSSNLNHRSLLHDLEVDVIIRSPAAKQALEEQFWVDLSQATEIKWIKWQKSSGLKKFFGRLLLYIKYWM